ncbi:transcriptional regulator with XRE-family HTH domain [Lentzea atacamensis]|uniref:Transcriptional regulator with XRE-family HTH domain n=1 Tax=Lentzea atacamensis TaxID=531938 RepID=A0A316HNE2_9PSEU|nr:helix-turn-helix domain-containing protein [Lentzea atacamensis]PWK82773.1 transcriptional regulator with XRE-family HTH domain [Lentzea atacamensis]RAS62585.1 transcriptional regulator with XRE-family HTH domain [Lentzea atacamensis]
MDGSFGALLRHHRLAAALTQETLAERAEISAQAIGALERGARRYPHRETVARLARALRLTPDQYGDLITAASRPPVPRADPEPPDERTVAAQLPAGVQGFTGREDVLLTMDALLAHEPNAVVVSAIAGMAGIGKTTLAVHWAHRARSRFPDGQLFLNLRGHGGGAPVTPLEALTHLLTGLGMERAKVPSDVESAAATYRTLLADRRVLVVLDDAVDARQVRPLLPGSPGCLVLVTSRYRLDGLVARDGARRIQLEQLSRDAARALLVHVLGEQRVLAEEEAVAGLVDLCAGLPLALRIAAAHLLGGRSIAGYVTALRSGDRLASLAAPGDPDTAVGAAFDLSYAALDPQARRVFRLMGLMPGRDLTADAIAALTELDAAETDRCLYALTAAHLVDEHSPGRYTFHDLLRLHAAHLADAEREAATERLWGHFALTLLNAGERVDPRTYRHVLAEDYRHTTFIDDTIANTWIDVETENLVATTHAAAAAGHTRLAVQLLIALHPQFERHRMESVWLATGTAVLEAARRSGDLLTEAHALRIIGDAHWCACDYEQSLTFLGEALSAAEALGHTEFYRVVLCALGRTSISMGRPRDCADYYQRARELWRQDGRPTDGSLVLGDAYWELGELDQAYELHTQAIDAARRKGVRFGVLLGETHAGRSCQALGRLDRAIEHYEAGLALCREFAEPAEEAGNLANLSGAYRDQEKYDLALDTAREALDIATRLGMRRTQISAWHVLGSTHLLLGYDTAARTELRTALDLAIAASHSRGRCDALISLAALHLRHSEHDSARALASEALTISRGTGHRLVEGESLRTLAEVDLAQRRFDDACRHAEQAGALHAKSGYRLGTERVADLVRRIAEACAG